MGVTERRRYRGKRRGTGSFVLRAVVWALAVLLALCVAALLLERRLLPAGEAGGALSAPGGQSPVLQAPQGPFEGAEERLCPVFPIEEQ